MSVETDSGDLDSLIHRHYPSVLAYAQRRLGNRHDAEDAAQETFVKIQQGIAGYDGRSRLSTWIYSVGHNVVIDQLRKRRRLATSGIWAETSEDRPAATGSDGMPGRDSRLTQLVSRLPPEDRQVLFWAFQENRSLRQIAARRREPVCRVRRQLQAALFELRSSARDEY